MQPRTTRRDDPGYHAAYYRANRSKMLARAAERRRTHKTEIVAPRSMYRASHKADLAIRNLVQKFKISWKDAETLIILRDGEGAWCDICRTTNGPFQIDHDHKIGQPRGILCRQCNHRLE